jgi:2-polyprenyl-6-methoxyphenol hydroxylase-like FAD-dependent oxidoreductase
MARRFDKQQVLVIGGGYAGALAAVRLAGKAKDRAAVTLLEPRTELVQRLRLHQLATGQKVRAYDLARLTGKRVTNLRGKAVAIDPGRGAVRPVVGQAGARDQRSPPSRRASTDDRARRGGVRPVTGSRGSGSIRQVVAQPRPYALESAAYPSVEARQSAGRAHQALRGAIRPVSRSPE